MSAPAVLGWRCWTWDARQRVLISPVRGTVWSPDGDHVAEAYSSAAALRGEAGIHASVLPGPGDAWLTAAPPEEWPAGDVMGIVALYGRVLEGEAETPGGPAGYRAQRGSIVALLCPAEIAVEVAAVYTGARVYALMPDGGAEEVA